MYSWTWIEWRIYYINNSLTYKITNYIELHEALGEDNHAIYVDMN